MSDSKNNNDIPTISGPDYQEADKVALLPQIKGYKIIKQLGEGGMGIVYLAEQTERIKRQVALKIIKPGMDSKQVITRFEVERQTLALLDHPNIAHIYDAGTTEKGRPYFVMEYVRGTRITDYCDQKKLSIEDRLKLFIQVCEAIQHAHQKGIIHRDIKPSNILVSVQNDKPILKVIDFGVAKALSQQLTEKTMFTEQVQFIGTPEYMSPEQADLTGQDIDTRTDVYSLGVLLYELLTGVLPFDPKKLREAAFEEVQRTIREEEPPKPSTRLSGLKNEAIGIALSRSMQLSTLLKSLHRELEWIPLMAIRKKRDRRYQSVSDLAEDINSYLAGNPLTAGPESKAYRAKKFIRRNRTIVSGIVIVILVLISGIIISLTFAFKAKHAAKVLQRALYFNHIALAQMEIERRNMYRAHELLGLCFEDYDKGVSPGWEWDYLWRASDQSVKTFRGHWYGINCIAISPDGKLVASGGLDKEIKVWNINVNNPPNSITFSGGEIMTLNGHKEQIISITFSPDGKRIVSADNNKTVKVWDLKNRKEIMTINRGGDKSEVNSLNFPIVTSSDGKYIATSSQKKTISIYDIENGAEVKILDEHANEIIPVTFSQDDKYIISADLDEGTKVWNWESGTKIRNFPYKSGDFRSIKTSFSGKYIAFGGYDKIIKIYSMTTGKEISRLHGHEDSVTSIDFSLDDARLVSGSLDKTVRLWDLKSGKELMTLCGHDLAISSVKFSPDGNSIISGAQDGTVKVWSTLENRKIRIISSPSSFIATSFAFSPDGKQIAISKSDFTGPLSIVSLNVANGEQTMLYDTDDCLPNSIAFSPNSKYIVSDCNKTVKLWDANSGKELRTLGGHQAEISSVAFSPDGKIVASGSYDKTIKLWDANSGKEIRALSGHQAEISSVAFSPDGKIIASGSYDKTIKLWDANSGKEIRSLIGHEGGINSVAFSPDGKIIVSASNDETLKLWNVRSGKEIRTLSGHKREINSVGFSPDGNRIISTDYEGTIKLWDSVSGSEVIALQDNPGLHCASFSPDGKCIATLITYGKVALWQSASFEELIVNYMNTRPYVHRPTGTYEYRFGGD